MSAFVSPEEIVIMFVIEVMIDDWLGVVNEDIATMEVDTAVDVITFCSETIHMK